MASRRRSADTFSTPDSKRAKWLHPGSDPDLNPSGSAGELVELCSGMDSGFSDGATCEDSQESFACNTNHDNDEEHARNFSEYNKFDVMPSATSVPSTEAGSGGERQSTSLSVPGTSADLDVGPNIQDAPSQTSANVPDDDNGNADDSLSDISGLSDLSGPEWKPNNAGAFSWVQHQMIRGMNPRNLLQEMISTDAEIPEGLDQLTLWKIILNMLSEPPRRKKLDGVNTIGNVVELIRTRRKIVILTGAGVSVSCGIPDFRSRDGVYARLAVDFPDLPDPQAMFDIHYFRKDPRPFFKFAREIYPGQFQPSPCHKFIKNVEKQGKLLRNYTQNIDTLEQVVGLQNVIQCHGSFATATCTRCKRKVLAEEIKDDIFAQKIPFCKVCPRPTMISPCSTSISNHVQTTYVGSNPVENTCSVDCLQTGDDHNQDKQAEHPPRCSEHDLFSPEHMRASVSDNPDTLTGVYEHGCSKHCTGKCKKMAQIHDSETALSSSSSAISWTESAGIMKPDIIFFGEGLGEEFHDSVAKDKHEVDLLIMIGSSLKVRPVALIPSSIPQNVPQVLINREPLPHLTPDVELLGDCDGIIDQICRMLGPGWEDAIHKTHVLEETTQLIGTDLDATQSSTPPKPETDEGTTSQPADDAEWLPTTSKRESLAATLSPGTYFFQPPNRYIFPGAEVYEDDDDTDDDESSSSGDNEEDQQNVTKSYQDGRQTHPEGDDREDESHGRQEIPDPFSPSAYLPDGAFHTPT